ncbi:MAG: helix-turn-helix domain-containing protein [Thermofilum sp.]
MRPGRRPSFNWKERVLEFLLKSGGARAGTIERTLGISHAQLHRVLKKLLSEGVIMRRGHMYVPVISEPPKECRAEVALIHALEMARNRLKMLATTHIEGRAPFIRIPLHVYAELFPERRIIHGPPVIEVPLESLDEAKLKLLEDHGLLRTRRKESIMELHFKTSRHPMEPGLFYKPVGEAQRIIPSKAEIQEIINDFIIEAAETIRDEAEKILREHGLTYDSLPDGPL